MGLEKSEAGRRFLRKKELQAVHRRILACALNCVTYAEAAGCEDRAQAVILAAYEPPLFAMIRELASWQKRLAELLDADDLAIWETYEDARNLVWYAPFSVREDWDEIVDLGSFLDQAIRRHGAQLCGTKYEQFSVATAEKKLAHRMGLSRSDLIAIIYGPPECLPDDFEERFAEGCYLTRAERAELRDILHPAVAGGVRAARLGELWEQAPRDLLFSDPDDLEEEEEDE